MFADEQSDSAIVTLIAAHGGVRMPSSAAGFGPIIAR